MAWDYNNPWSRVALRSHPLKRAPWNHLSVFTPQAFEREIPRFCGEKVDASVKGKRIDCCLMSSVQLPTDLSELPFRFHDAPSHALYVLVYRNAPELARRSSNVIKEPSNVLIVDWNKVL